MSSDKEQEQDRVDDHCVICLEPLLDKTAGALTSCGHVYHVECLTQCIRKNKPECPACKRMVPLTPMCKKSSQPILAISPLAFKVCKDDHGSTMMVGRFEKKRSERMQTLRDKEQSEQQEKELQFQVQVEHDSVERVKSEHSDVYNRIESVAEEHRCLTLALDHLQAELDEVHGDCVALTDQIDNDAKRLRKGLIADPMLSDPDVCREKALGCSSARMQQLHDALTQAAREYHLSRSQVKQRLQDLAQQKEQATKLHAEASHLNSLHKKDSLVQTATPQSLQQSRYALRSRLDYKSNMQGIEYEKCDDGSLTKRESHCEASDDALFNGFINTTSKTKQCPLLSKTRGHATFNRSDALNGTNSKRADVASTSNVSVAPGAPCHTRNTIEIAAATSEPSVWSGASCDDDMRAKAASSVGIREPLVERRAGNSNPASNNSNPASLSTDRNIWAAASSDDMESGSPPCSTLNVSDHPGMIGCSCGSGYYSASGVCNSCGIVCTCSGPGCSGCAHCTGSSTGSSCSLGVDDPSGPSTGSRCSLGVNDPSGSACNDDLRVPVSAPAFKLGAGADNTEMLPRPPDTAKPSGGRTFVAATACQVSSAAKALGGKAPGRGSKRPAPKHDAEQGNLREMFKQMAEKHEGKDMSQEVPEIVANLPRPRKPVAAKIDVLQMLRSSAASASMGPGQGSEAARRAFSSTPIVIDLE
eukprot:gnl/MRDRNA2_/MRDRNA2_77493_c0_seq1.p1 gnl/MRDRNA2_/MRDRNA2_77493_c0~~gnl/MRDRNA2_/MRDRNA2_77493_c0_seq1.p1  ORF type:complete len:702 (-),score=125.96 gnl/MRDRNA2_/MRDRNA2_77493_c0_seq1:80-2185(-)